jgi:hypothetical protein
LALINELFKKCPEIFSTVNGFDMCGKRKINPRNLVQIGTKSLILQLHEDNYNGGVLLTD